MSARRTLLLVAAAAATTLGATAPAAGTPECFGAASRDAERPCHNPSLATSVKPRPRDALLMPASRCKVTSAKSPWTCAFGASKRRARATIVMLGDSHAPAWRAAADTLVRGRRWRALSIARSSCPFAYAKGRDVGEERAAACSDWIADVHRWFRRHGEIRTVLFVNSSAYRFAPGEDPVAGYRAALDALPPSVRNVVVIRDNPIATHETFPCVDRAVQRRDPPGTACALDRATSLLPDYAAEAAPGLAGGRGHVIDLTDFFCDAERCLPVVGGALVHKDTSHINRVFARTLGPYLARRFRALGLTPPA